MTRAPLVSVVTPVFNDAELLEECIVSVRRQTYTNWTQTIVDNASTDETPAVASRHAALDSRIRYRRFDEFVNSNESHNRAFRSIDSESEYCKIVDADDWLYPDCLSLMVEIAEASPTVGIVSSYRMAGDRVDLTGLPPETTVMGGLEVIRRSLLGQVSVLGGPTATLIRSRLVREHDPFYDRRYFHSDTDAAYRILLENDLGFVHEVLTFARRQSDRLIDYSHRMNTFAPEYICFLLRFGPDVLDRGEYRDQLRRNLTDYTRWHLRQFVRPSRFADPDFFRVHGERVEEISNLGRDDRDVRRAVAVLRLLLARGAWHRTSSRPLL
jgi:glycosyltransferase involved in cell wall biosynthesis